MHIPAHIYPYIADIAGTKNYFRATGTPFDRHPTLATYQASHVIFNQKGVMSNVGISSIRSVYALDT